MANVPTVDKLLSDLPLASFACNMSRTTEYMKLDIRVRDGSSLVTFFHTPTDKLGYIQF